MDEAHDYERKSSMKTEGKTKYADLFEFVDKTDERKVKSQIVS